MIGVLMTLTKVSSVQGEESSSPWRGCALVRCAEHRGCAMPFLNGGATDELGFHIV